MESMSRHTKASSIDHSAQVASSWVDDVAREFDTLDKAFAYRVLRAWLHCLRDRLTVETSAQFASQLPDLLRGVFYENWEPNKVPTKFGVDGYIQRFAEEAGIATRDVSPAAATTTAALLHHLPVDLIDKVFERLPTEIRAILQPAQMAADRSS
jgi:uncharacterized protein (DUF2267 family)